MITNLVAFCQIRSFLGVAIEDSFVQETRGDFSIFPSGLLNALDHQAVSDAV